MAIIGPNNFDSNIGTHLTGKVNIDILNLKTIYGEVVSLLSDFNGIVISENMFSTSIFGTISVVDRKGILEKFLLTGGEEIELKISKQITNDLLLWRRDLVVYKISKSTLNNIDLSTTFTLFFTTRFFVKSSKRKIFRSFKNTTVKNAVNSIYSEITSNGILIEDVNLNFENPYICPGLTPHDTIDQMAKMSCSDKKFYVFFERASPFVFKNNDDRDASSHYFGSVENLISSQGNQVFNIVYKENENYGVEINLGSNIIKTNSFSRLSNFNHMDSMLSGAYNIKVTSIDPIQRTWNIVKKSYVTEDVNGDFYTNPIISKNISFSQFDDLNYEFPGERLVVSTKFVRHSKNNWLSEYMYGFITKNIFKVEVVIEGGTNNIGTGTVINLNVPSHYKKIINSENSNIENDIVYSGKYIVTAVKHEITLENYKKTLELSRGSTPINLGRVTPSTTSKSITDITNKTEKTYTLFEKRKYPSVVNKTISVSILKSSIEIVREETGFPNQQSLSILYALGIQLSGNLLSDRSYRVLAQSIKNGEFVNIDDAIYVTYPGNVNRLSSTDASTIRNKIQELL